IHFGDSKITGSLEEYITAKIDGELDEAQIKDILSMLFDKEHVDISEYSEEDFGMAFIKLSEEKKRAMLMEMGYSKEQIDSILDSCKGNKAVTVGNSIGRTLIEKIADKDGNKHGRLGNTGKASTLGLAGIKRPGQFNTDFAKTDADAYDVAGGSKTKTGGNTGKNSGSSSTGNNSGSSSTGNNPNPGGTSTTPSGNGIETTPEEVQEWVESGDTASMNAYIEETSQNVDEWDSNRAANLGIIYQWSLQSGNTEIVEKFANHFLNDTEYLGEDHYDNTAKDVYYSFEMNKAALEAVYNALPGEVNHDIYIATRNTLKELMDYEGWHTVHYNRMGEVTSGYFNATLNDNYQIELSIEGQTSDNNPIKPITSSHSILENTPSYVIDYWIDSKDNDKLCAYVDASPILSEEGKEVWEPNRDDNLAIIWKEALSCSGNEDIIECFIDLAMSSYEFGNDCVICYPNKIVIDKICDNYDWDADGVAHWTLARMKKRPAYIDTCNLSSRRTNKEISKNYLDSKVEYIDGKYRITFANDGTAITAVDVTEEVGKDNIDIFKEYLSQNKNIDNVDSAIRDLLLGVYSDIDVDFMKKIISASAECIKTDAYDYNDFCKDENRVNPFTKAFQQDPYYLSDSVKSSLYSYIYLLLGKETTVDVNTGKITDPTITNSIVEDFFNGMLSNQDGGSCYRRDYLNYLTQIGNMMLEKIFASNMYEAYDEYEAGKSELSTLKTAIYQHAYHSKLAMFLNTLYEVANSTDNKTEIQLDNIVLTEPDKGAKWTKCYNALFDAGNIMDGQFIFSLRKGEAKYDLYCGKNLIGSDACCQKSEKEILDNSKFNVGSAMSTIAEVASVCSHLPGIGGKLCGIVSEVLGHGSYLSELAEKYDRCLSVKELFYQMNFDEVLEYGNNGNKTQGGGLVNPYDILSTEAALRYHMIEKNGFSIFMDCDDQKKEEYAAILMNSYIDSYNAQTSTNDETTVNDGTYDAEEYAKMYFVFTGKNIDENHNYSWSNGEITAGDIIKYCEYYNSLSGNLFPDEFQDKSLTSNYIVTED
uniref:hypothetical protein n=2 Tax=Butyrivibrio fibrisolvens TaxID=831 RepID=UPI0005591B6F